QFDSNGTLIEFPIPPLFVSPRFDPMNPQILLPYQPKYVGRFGGTISVNSAGSFYRGVTIGMPQPHGIVPPPAPVLQLDGLGNPILSAGLTSIARIDVVGTDDVVDFVFGMPYVAGYLDYWDYDPCDGNGNYGD